MRHIYCILFHKNPKQLKRLLTVLNDREVFFVIHVCLNYENFPTLEHDLSTFHNLYFCKRERATWGSYYLAKAILNAIEKATKSIHGFDFFTVLSAQDYPIKSNDHIRGFLRNNLDKEFINYELIHPTLNEEGNYFHPIKQQWTDRNVSFKYEYYYLKIHKNLYVLLPGEKDPHRSVKSKFLNFIKGLLQLLIPNRKFPKGYTPYHGSTWFTISHKFCDYLIHRDNRRNNYNQFMKKVFTADEIYFQTLAMNSPFKERVVNDNLNLIKWDRGPHPIILNYSHFNEIKEAPESKLFARKFDTTIDSDILDKIDSELLRISAKPTTLSEG